MDYGSQTTSGVGSELLTASLSLEIIGNVYAAGMPRNGSRLLRSGKISRAQPVNALNSCRTASTALPANSIASSQLSFFAISHSSPIAVHGWQDRNSARISRLPFSVLRKDSLV
jgi:hypothetical protein